MGSKLDFSEQLCKISSVSDSSQKPTGNTCLIDGAWILLIYKTYAFELQNKGIRVTLIKSGLYVDTWWDLVKNIYTVKHLYKGHRPA